MKLHKIPIRTGEVSKVSVEKFQVNPPAQFWETENTQICFLFSRLRCDGLEYGPVMITKRRREKGFKGLLALVLLYLV